MKKKMYLKLKPFRTLVEIEMERQDEYYTKRMGLNNRRGRDE